MGFTNYIDDLWELGRAGRLNPGSIDLPELKGVPTFGGFSKARRLNPGSVDLPQPARNIPTGTNYAPRTTSDPLAYGASLRGKSVDEMTVGDVIALNASYDKAADAIDLDALNAFPSSASLQKGNLGRNLGYGALGLGLLGAGGYGAYTMANGQGTPPPVDPPTSNVDTTPPPDYSPQVLAKKKEEQAALEQERERFAKKYPELVETGVDPNAVGGEAFYRIKRGDTLGDLTSGDYALARKIADYNNLADWNMINEGASLRLKDEWLSPSSRLLNNTLAGIRYPG